SFHCLRGFLHIHLGQVLTFLQESRSILLYFILSGLTDAYLIKEFSASNRRRAPGLLNNSTSNMKLRYVQSRLKRLFFHSFRSLWVDHFGFGFALTTSFFYCLDFNNIMLPVAIGDENLVYSATCFLLALFFIMCIQYLISITYIHIDQ